MRSLLVLFMACASGAMSLCVSLPCGAQSPAADAATNRPNILFILADDLAWSDLACYGHPYHATPHLDRLAAAGLLFRQAYAPAPICSASRASFLTGKTPARLGFEFVTKDEPGHQKRSPSQLLETPPFTLSLPLAETTIAERLATAGYHTAFFGKWHLNPHYRRYLGWSPTEGPKQQGFQTAVEDFGGHPYSYSTEGKPAAITEPGQYPRDSMIERAAAFLREPHDAPFFLMVSQFYVHTPVETPCTWLLEKYDALVPEESPSRANRVAYGAFVETLDHYVGRVLAALDEAGHADDTLVVFTSDNGGHPEYAANAPLRGSKWNLYEGGIREPMIARWPGVITPSGTCSTPVVGYDLLPTFAEVAGTPIDRKQTDARDAIDGQSLAALFRDPTTQVDRSLVWHFPYYHPESGFEKCQPAIGIDDFAVSQTRPHSAIRRGSLKLLHFYEDDRLELYDLEHDPGEQHDLSRDRGKAAAELAGALERYLDEVNARRPTIIATSTAK